MQEVQAHQEKIIALQDQIGDLEKEIEALQNEADSQKAEKERLLRSLERREKELEALAYFYTLQQQYLSQSYEGCQATIHAMEAAGMDDVLPTVSSAEGVTSPAERYLQLKDAVAVRLT